MIVVFVTVDLKRVLKISACVLLIVAALLLIIKLTQSKTADDAAVLNPGYTLVIDAGHGGIDGGAVSASGVKESDINLDIALKTEAIADFLGIDTVMTRTDDRESSGCVPYSEHNDLLHRAETANSAANGVLISIHQNTFPTPKVAGAEVMYADTEGSEEFGIITQNNLVSYADPSDRRVARQAPKELLLTTSVRCPAILVECGFLSNPTEAEKLSDDGYQLKLAAVFAASFLQFSHNMTI